jgi:acyl-coenzyme A synthetase/AMP-(fatty) acid ligase
VQAHAANTPDKVAIVDGRRTMTYGHLAHLTDVIALGLQECGLQPRDAVSVQLPNWCEFIVAALAIERAGGVVNPISPIMRERELTQMLGAAEARIFIVPDVFRGHPHAQVAMDLRGKACPALENVIVVGDDGPAGTRAWRALEDRANPTASELRGLDAVGPDPNDVVLLSFTSGTTGEPKGVMHTSSTLGAFIRSGVKRQRFGPDTRVFMPATLGHGYY